MKVRLLGALSIVGVMSLSCVPASAVGENAASESRSVVLELRSRLPVVTPASGTLISVDAPDAPLTVVTDMGDVSGRSMENFARDPDSFKNAILTNIKAMGQDLLQLAYAAYNAGIPFSIHLTSESYPQGFTITFSVEELGKCLASVN